MVKRTILDKLFFTFKCEQLKGNLKTEFEGGKNLWLTREKIFKLPTLFDGVEGSLDSASNKHLDYKEAKYTVKGY